MKHPLTERERFLRTMRFQPVDRLPIWHIGQWPETLQRWHEEGLPAEVEDVRAYLGFDRREGMGLNLELDPPFEETVLEEDADTQVRRRSDGAIERVLKQGRGRSMPQWLEYPVRTRADWERLAEQLNPDSPGRFPPDWEERKQRWAGRDWPLSIEAGSFYGVLRNWLGLERLSLTLYDDPAWVEEMLDRLTDLYLVVLDRALSEVKPRPDFAGFWEDMCYKTGPLISPNHFRRFLLPRYRRVTGLLRDHGVEAIFVDSDGNIEELILLWLEGGVNGFHPPEVAAGMDPVALRKRYGKRVLLRGGIDKRKLALGGEVLRKEVMGKVPFLARTGGYIPYIDHATPPDVSWPNFLEYARLVRSAAVVTPG